MEIFQNLKANKFSQNRTEKKLILHGKTSTIPYLINQNEIFYLEDYPIFNDEMYAQDATILSNVFFNKNNILLNEFKLWLQLAQM